MDSVSLTAEQSRDTVISRYLEDAQKRAASVHVFPCDVGSQIHVPKDALICRAR